MNLEFMNLLVCVQTYVEFIGLCSIIRLIYWSVFSRTLNVLVCVRSYVECIGLCSVYVECIGLCSVVL